MIFVFNLFSISKVWIQHIFNDINHILDQLEYATNSFMPLPYFSKLIETITHRLHFDKLHLLNDFQFVSQNVIEFLQQYYSGHISATK